MQYSEINNRRLSKLTLGTVALGKDYGISNKSGKPALTDSREILSSALNAGINFIDTANDYGNAEQIIGEYLEKYKNGKQVNVVTKFKISKANLLNKERARAEAFRSVRSSLQLLKTKRVAICLFHKSMDQPVEQVLEILPSLFSDLINDGLADTCGVSVFHPDELNTFLSHPVLQAFQSPMNLFDQRLIKNGALKKLNEEKKILFIRSVFLQGLFFMSPDELTGNLAQASEYIRTLQGISTESGMSIAQLAFSYLRDLDGISSLVFGAVAPEQVMQNAGLLNGPALSRELRLQIEKRFADVPEEIITPALWSL
ncbi:MAG TPA: aldo/keto reductase [Puia sp.]|jgi:aryl-alcohol dehydrogenase-like predicted oxidoreductase